MRALGRQLQRAPDGAAVHNERYRSQQTTLYRLVRQHAASFIAPTDANTGPKLPRRMSPVSHDDEADTSATQ